MTAKKTVDLAINREDWLTRAALPLINLIEESTELRMGKRKVVVSCGWPGGRSVNKVIGQCWPTATGKGVAQMFISPKLVKVDQILETLLHELIHAADDCEHGHKGPFVKACRAVGLEGKPTATFAGDELRKKLKKIASIMGPYPHKGVTPGLKIKTQGTRMLKLEAVECCGYVVRTTQKWIDEGLPSCPCGNEMEVAS